jgi:hypothetical protein
MSLRIGLGFIFLLALALAGTSWIFRSGSNKVSQASNATTLAQSDLQTSDALEAEAIGTEKGMTDDSLDGDSRIRADEETAEEPESNLENVFLSLGQEMARRGYSKELTECIESQFRENLGIENPKDLDSMLSSCDNQFKVDAIQSKQIKEVVLQAIAKAQNKPESEAEKTSLQ